MGKRRSTALLAMGLLACATPALAEVKAGDVTVGGFIGAYRYDGKEHQKAGPELGLRGGYSFTDHFAIEAAVAAADSKSKPTDNDVDLYNYHLDALYHFQPGEKLVPYLAAGFGALQNEGDIDFKRGAFNAGGGVKYFVNETVDLRGDLRAYLFSVDDTLFNYEANLGVDFILGRAKPAPKPTAVVPPPAPADSDQDGVIDANDKCPGTGAGVKVDASGCPLDSDKDGVIDAEDQCPGTEAGVKVDVRGCPAPVVAKDSDGDGVIDAEDKCLGTAAGVKVDASGCPLDSDKDGVIDANDKCPGTPAGVKVDSKGCPLDSDKDGIADNDDKCPATPVGVKVDSKGCPLDSDKDGVADNDDQCPNTRAGLAVDRKGCPPPIEENVKIAIGVLFASGKANINEKDTADIKKLAEFLKTYPGTTTTIEGHTDNVGSAALNKALSQKRADAVRQYLVDKEGIEASRVTAIGYGPERPVADNATAEGRAKNRRIEAAVETTVLKPQE